MTGEEQNNNEKSHPESEGEEKSGGESNIVPGVIIVFVLYILSMGPMLGITHKLSFISNNATSWEATNTIYRPVVWISYAFGMAEVLISYIRFWIDLF